MLKVKCMFRQSRTLQNTCIGLALFFLLAPLASCTMLNAPTAVEKDRPRPATAQEAAEIKLLTQQMTAYLNNEQYTQARPVIIVLLSKLEPTLGRDNENTIKVRELLVLTYMKLGDYAAAQNELARVLDAEERTFGKDHEKTRETRQNLATLQKKADADEIAQWGRQAVDYLNRKQFAQARQVLERMLPKLDSELGPDNAETIKAREMLAYACIPLGDAATASALFEQVIAAKERVLGKDHPDTQATRRNFTALQKKFALPESASITTAANAAAVSNPPDSQKPLSGRQRFEKDFTQSVSTLSGPEASARAAQLTALKDQGLLCDKEGKYAEARDAFAELSAGMEAAFGAEHPVTIASRDLLAEAYTSTGDYSASQRMYTQLLEVSERVLGKEHQYTLSIRLGLASTYYYRGEQRKSMELQAQTLSIMERTLGYEHPDSLTARHNLASSHMARGDYNMAKTLMEKNMEAAQRTLDKDNENLLSYRNGLAEACLRLGEHERAGRMLARVLEDSRRIRGEAHPLTAGVRSNLAQVYMLQGKTEEAKTLLSQAARDSETSLGNAHPDTLKIRSNLAQSEATSGNYADAQEQLANVARGKENTLGQDHPSTLVSLSNQAGIALDMGDYATARDIYSRILGSSTRVQGEDHPDTLAALNSLAAAYSGLGEHEKAEECQQRAIHTAERVLGRDHPSTFMYIVNLAKIQADKGRHGESVKCLERVLKEAKPALGEEHSIIVAARHNLAFSYAELGETDKAKAHTLDILATEHIIQGKFHNRTAQEMFLLSMLVAAQKPEAAAFYGKLAVLATREQRDKIQRVERGQQQTFVASMEHRYHFLMDVLLNAERNTEAQAILYFLKEDELEDSTRSRMQQAAVSTAIMVGREVALYGEYNRLAASLYSLGTRYAALADKKRSGEFNQAENAEFAVLSKKLESERTNFLTFMSRVERELAGSGAESREEAAKLQNMADLLNIFRSSSDGSVIIHTLSAEKNLYVFLTTPAGMTVRKLPVSREALKNDVESFRNALRDPGGDPRPAAQKLYNLIIRPIQAGLQAAKAKTLLFSLDGILRYAPMSALHDGNAWLVESYDVAMFTEAARHTLKNKPTVQAKMAALGVTKALAGFSALPAVAEEVRGIVKEPGKQSGVVPGTVDLDSAFTRRTFSQRLKDGAPLVHLASHFQFEPAAQASSFLLLGDGSKLTMADMFIDESLNFNAVDLLTLSACDTASGLKKGDGREVESFGAMALRHGVKAVLAALWPVADASTAGLMQEFYRLRAEDGQSKAQALCAAQRAFARGENPGAATQAASSQRGKLGGQGAAVSTSFAGYAHPHYWAPFVLMGNWQ